MVPGSRVKRRILQTSDLHLMSLGDRSTPTSEAAADKAARNLEATVNLAIETKVDLVIIAGDLFDHNRVDDRSVSFVVEQLKRLPVYVAILPGNHDCLSPDSVYHRVGLWGEASNVRIFGAPGGETLDLPGLGVSLWGKSIDSLEDDTLPLAGIPQPRENGQWHVAVAHGYYVGDELPRSTSYHITHQEIIASGWDYIALGHSTAFRCVCDGPVKACYCGSPSLGGTVAFVDLAEETGVQVTCYSL